MIPRLPPESIAHIQALAEEGEPPARRKSLRATFELVNKEWHSLVDHHTFLIVTELSDVARLHSSERRPDSWGLVRTKTRTIAVELDELESREETEVLCMLLYQASAAVSVTLNILAGGQMPLTGGEDGIGLVHALGRLANVRHCELRRLGTAPPRPVEAGLDVTQA